MVPVLRAGEGVPSTPRWVQGRPAETLTAVHRPGSSPIPVGLLLGQWYQALGQEAAAGAWRLGDALPRGQPRLARAGLPITIRRAALPTPASVSPAPLPHPPAITPSLQMSQIWGSLTWPETVILPRPHLLRCCARDLQVLSWLWRAQGPWLPAVGDVAGAVGDLSCAWHECEVTHRIVSRCPDAAAP